MKKIAIILFLTFLFLANGINAQPKGVTFIAFGHTYPDYDALNASVDLVNKENPDFVVFLGDSVLIGEEKYWKELLSITSRISAPVYFVPGNHEIEVQPKGVDYFEDNIHNPMYWNFTIEGTTFIILNTVLETSGQGKATRYDISSNQVGFIKSIYESDPNPKFIFMHHCIFYNYDNQFCNSRDFFLQNNWNSEIVPIIQNKTIAVFVGDTGINEPYFGYTENNISYFGVGFSPKEGQLKIPPHMLKVTFSENNLKVIPIPIYQDLTEVQYFNRTDREFFPLFKVFIKKNLALVLKATYALITILLIIILFLLFKINNLRKKHHRSSKSTP